MYQKASTLDIIYRKLLLTKFFTRGWGNPATIKRQFDFLRVLADRSSCQKLVDEHYPVTIDSDVEKGDVRIVDGHFRSPFDRYLPNVMPQEVKTARFQLIVPTQWPTHRQPVCIHMAGTGDHYFWRRRTMLGRPLIKEYGIGSLLLENPFYGCRKPKDQLRSSLRHVNELFVMGGGLILEGLVMLHWCEKQGFGPLGLTGISMGGHMATLTATNWHKPIPLIPCLSWSSATPVFTEGVMSGSIHWPVLATQYVGHTEYEGDIMKKLLKCPKTDAFRIGQEFVWNYPESLHDLKGVKVTAGAKSKEQTSSIPKTNTVGKPPAAKASDPHQTSALEDSGDAGISSDISKESFQRSVLENGESASELWPIGKTDLQRTVAQSLGGSNRTVGSVEMEFERKEELVCQKHDSNTCTCAQHDSVHEPTSAGRQRNAKHSGAKADLFSDPTSKCKSKSSSGNPKSSAVYGDGAVNSEKSERSDQRKGSGTKQESEKKRSFIFNTAKRKSVKGLENYQELKKDALEFMRGVMDVTTYVGNFSTPVDSSLVIVVTALRDGYIPRRGVPSLDELWPGVEVRYIDGGHISAFLFKQAEFRKAINDAFNMYLAKYEDDPVKKTDAHSEAQS